MKNIRIVFLLLVSVFLGCSSQKAPEGLVSDLESEKVEKSKFPEDEILKYQKKQELKQRAEVEELRRQKYHNDRLRGKFDTE